MELDAVIKQKIGTPFPSTAFNYLKMRERGSSEDRNVTDKEEDRKNSPPTTPLSERPTEPAKMLKSCPFGGELKGAGIHL